MNGSFNSFFWTALFRTKEMEQIEPNHLIGSFGCVETNGQMVLKFLGIPVKATKREYHIHLVLVKIVSQSSI